MTTTSNPEVSVTPSGPDDDDVEEVTETKIIGVTETGVIRKRSFKRKVTKEEKSKRGYGMDKAEYDKIVERVMAERYISSAVEGLQERWKMLGFMHTDCMDMVKQWEESRGERLQQRRNRELDIVIAVGVASIIFLMLCWLVKLCIF